MSILQLENIMYNGMAHARSSCVYTLHEDSNIRQFYFARAHSYCGCGYELVGFDLPLSRTFRYWQPDAADSNGEDSGNEW